MTEQVADSISVDGRPWMISDEDGALRSLAPTDEQLGIRPISTSTANWRGRIDHYIVFCDQLFLHKVEVQNMADDWKYLPPGARREERTIYPQWESYDGDGLRIVERPEKSYFYVYDDLFIPFSGTITAAWPYWNWWDFPMAGQYDFEALLSPREELFLEFSQGELIESEVGGIPDPEQEALFQELVKCAKELKKRGRGDV